jgi:hypothetical protein
MAALVLGCRSTAWTEPDCWLLRWLFITALLAVPSAAQANVCPSPVRESASALTLPTTHAGLLRPAAADHDDFSDAEFAAADQPTVGNLCGAELSVLALVLIYFVLAAVLTFLLLILGAILGADRFDPPSQRSPDAAENACTTVRIGTACMPRQKETVRWLAK